MTRFVEADPKYINGRIGVDIAPRDMAALLCCMQLPTKVRRGPSRGGSPLAPMCCTCDVAEDVAAVRTQHQQAKCGRTFVGAQQP